MFVVALSSSHALKPSHQRKQENCYCSDTIPRPRCKKAEIFRRTRRGEEMIGAVQLGLFAACVVLFVPMGMAGWHLSRNKILFFSCALFITLAVGVHLMPYFPSISDILTPTKVIPAPISLYRDSCITFLHSVMYSGARECDERLMVFDDSRCKRSWDWIESAQVAECGFQKLRKLEASDLLNGSWIVVAGDSQVRLMVVSLLQLLLGSENVERVRRDLFKRHSNYSITMEEIGVKLDFVWAPYVKNLTELMSQFRRSQNYPDVMLMGAGLWDMLHISNSSEYGISLRVLRDNVLALLPVASDMDGSAGVLSQLKYSNLLHLFWVSMPKLITSMLSTEEKRTRMTSELCDYYEHELAGSKLLRQYGGPLFKLDIRWLSDLCGTDCTTDGMHYDEVVYDSALQIMLNALLIKSNQKP